MFSFFRRSKKEAHRDFPRGEVEQFLTVYDEDKFVLLGRITDLSIGGICVVSEISIQLGNVVKLAIEIPSAQGEAETLWVLCESVWQKPDEINDLYKIGFRFVGLSPSNYKRIKDILRLQKH
jgi:c-di-GMP-binding flagellar brake protein YcgR